MIKSFAHGAGIESLENDIPETVGEPVALLHAFWAVMVIVVPFDIAEVRASEVIKVHGVMYPFLEHIALHHSRQKDGKRVGRCQKAHRRGNEEQRKQVTQLSVDVMSVERAVMVFPVERIQALVQ